MDTQLTDEGNPTKATPDEGNPEDEGANMTTTGTSQPSLEGWDITHAEDADWTQWGDGGKARAKVLGSADGYLLMLVEAQTTYVGAPHEHESAEFFYLIRGRLRNQGQVLRTGDGYAAAARSVHEDFEALEPSTYLVIFRL